MSAREVALSLDITPQRLNYYLRKWKTLDVIRQVGYGTWEVNEAKRHLVLERVPRPRKHVKTCKKVRPMSVGTRGGVRDEKFLHVAVDSSVPPEIGQQDSVESHGFMFVLRLPNLIRWNERGRREYLLARGVAHAVIPQGERLDPGQTLGWKVHLTNQSLVSYAPKGFRWSARTAAEGFREAFYEYLRVVKRVERLMGVSFGIGGRYKVKTTREHHALVENALASEYTRRGEKLYVRDELGLWALIDASVDPGEFETVRAGPPGRDANRKVQDFFNGVKATGVTPEFILESIHGLTKNAEVFGEHMRTHVSVMQNIDVTLKRLNEWMEERRR